MARKKKKPKKAGSYRHDSATRINQPTTETSPLMASAQRAAQRFALEGRDTGLAVEEATTERSEQPEPRLAWDRQGHTSERDGSIDFAGIPLYIREKVHPLAMIDQLRKPDTGSQGDLFDDFNGLPPDAPKWEFYQHSGNWQNRLIHGDSSEVMQSLIARDGLAGQVQMIYFDPPYGIRFKSNFMTATDKMETTDNAKGVPFGDAPPPQGLPGHLRTGYPFIPGRNPRTPDPVPRASQGLGKHVPPDRRRECPPLGRIM